MAQGLRLLSYDNNLTIYFVEKDLVTRYAIKSLIMENNINYAALTQDEIIFIDRNKAYGAFALRLSYNEHIKRAMLGTIFFTTFVIGVQQLIASRHPLADKPEIGILAKTTDVQIVTPPPPPPPKPQVKALPPAGSPEAATQRYAEMKPAEDNNHTDSVAPIEANVEISDHTHEGLKGEKTGVKDGSDIAINVVQPPKEIPTVSVAEFMPEFPGGESALLAFIRNHINYPDYENTMGIQGKAVIGFVVDEYGKVTNVKVLKSVSKGIDRESMRVIQSLPAFKPGMQSGRNVRVSFVVPIDFHQKAD